MASPTSLLYACIAHNSTILAECTTSASSQTSSLAALILPRIEHRSPEKLTYTHGSHYIHYVAEAPSSEAAVKGAPSVAGLTFLAIADASLGRRVPFAFLDDIRARFLDEFPPAATDFADLPNYGCAAFNGTLRTQMLARGTAAAAAETDALTGVRRDIDDVRGIMGRNIESLLERGERIDLLVDQTDRLGGSAREFRVRSRGLKRQMWWKNVKLMALVVLVVILVVVMAVLAIKI